MLESSSLYFLVMRNPYQIIYAFIHVINMLEQTSYGILVYIYLSTYLIADIMTTLAKESCISIKLVIILLLFFFFFFIKLVIILQ